MFLLSSAVILIVCGILCMVLARRITWPIEQISQAAKRLGGGDFTARAPVTGCQELADFATTFNNMAGRLQNIDNSRGQFMGNIAHELRTPMTSITSAHCSSTAHPFRCTHRFGVTFSPGHLRRTITRPVSYYALFKCVAASEPTSWLSVQFHILLHLT